MTDDMSTAEHVELRGPCPRETVDVLDAISMARNLTRTQMVNEILGEWARRIQHEHMVLARTMRVIPPDAESNGRGRA